MSKNLKRTYSTEIYSTKFKKSKPKTLKLYKSLTNKGSFGTYFRSGYQDLQLIAGQTYPYGMSFNSTGFIIGNTLTTWTGSTDISLGWDAYRLNKVTVEFIFNNNFSQVNGVATTMPYIFIVNDYDDSNVTAITDIVQRDGCRCELLDHKITQGCVPKLAITAFATTTTNGYMEPKAHQWVSTGPAGSFTDPQHYGIKIFIDASKMTNTTGSIGNLKVFVKAYFELKHSQ